MDRYSILMSCYACEPDKGSEPGVGWNWALSMSDEFNVSVLTRANNRNVIEGALGESGKHGLSFIYYDLPSWVLVLKKRRIISTSLYYILWQLGARRMLGKSVDDFDIVHHMTFNMFLCPGFWRPKKAELLLGPLGGGSCVDKNYLALFGTRAWVQRLRSRLVHLWKYVPSLKKTFESAKLILCANQDTHRLLEAEFQSKCRIHLETGIPESKIAACIRQRPAICKFIQIGNLEPRKGWTLTIRAVAELCHGRNHKNFECHFLGSGPELDKAKMLASDLGVDEIVHFHGQKPFDEAHQMLADSDVLMFPSVRDTSGNVVLEAMAMAKPVICFDHQGAKEMTNDRCAIRIEPSPVDESIHLIASAMEKLMIDDDLRMEMGRQGVEKSLKSHTWAAKQTFMEGIYRELLHKDANG